MKKFKFSLLFSIIIIILHFFLNEMQNSLKSQSAFDISSYFIYGLLIPFLIIVLIKALLEKNELKISSILVIIGIIIYFFLIKSYSPLIVKLSLFSFIIIGVIYSFENLKIRSVIPLILIVITSYFAEIAIHKSLSISFYHYDIFLRVLMSYAGYTASTLVFRK